MRKLVVLKSVGTTSGFSIEWFEFSNYKIKIFFCELCCYESMELYIDFLSKHLWHVLGRFPFKRVIVLQRYRAQSWNTGLKCKSYRSHYLLCTPMNCILHNCRHDNDDDDGDDNNNINNNSNNNHKTVTTLALSF